MYNIGQLVRIKTMDEIRNEGKHGTTNNYIVEKYSDKIFKICSYDEYYGTKGYKLEDINENCQSEIELYVFTEDMLVPYIEIDEIDSMFNLL